MDSEIMVEALPLLGMCNLCLNEGAVKSMLLGHTHNGKTEVYAEMLVKCFTIDVSLLQLGDTKRLICDLCISRLRDCLLFRDQVEASFNTLESTYKMHNGHPDDAVKNETVELEECTPTCPADKPADDVVEQDVDTMDDGVDLADDGDKRDPDGIKREITSDVDMGDDYHDGDDDEYDDDEELDGHPDDAVKNETVEFEECTPTCPADKPADDVVEQDVDTMDDGVDLADDVDKRDPDGIKREITSNVDMGDDYHDDDDDEYDDDEELDGHPDDAVKNETVELEECTPTCPADKPADDVVEQDVATMDDGVDFADDDAESLKSEPSPKPVKKSPKKKKIKVKAKSSKRKKTVNGKCAKEKISKRRTRSEANLEYQHVQKVIEPERPPRKIPKKYIDTEQKSFANTIAVVENSFVCPFDTSFSDYYCIYCREVFTDPNKLREHTSTHDPATFKDRIANKKLLLVDIFRIDCRLCPITIDNIESLKSHLTTTHGKELYKTSNEFVKFRLTVNNLTCTECSSSFSFFHALKKHMAEHFGTCICDICGAHYFEERMLILHQKTHQKVDENFPCKDCGKIFKSKHSRYLHEAKLHKKEPAYQCYKCDEVFFSYSLRYRHMIETHGEQRMFPCEHCERAYDSRKSLREHIRRHHLKIFKHQCDQCDKRFYLPSRLKEHMATHTGERNFRCEFCGKSYPRLRGLKVHMQSHVNEKKFSCVMCNASFTQNINLKNHMKRQHQSLDLEDGYPE